MTLTRGVSPSSARIFLDPPPVLSQAVGTLRFSDSGRNIDLMDAALAPQTLRLWKGRDAMIWSVQVMDRRWKWRYPRISGEYNRRGCDGRVVESTRMTLRKLLETLLEALGEPDAVLDGIPAGIFPEVHWDAVRADLELGLLCERHGLVPWLGLDNRAHVAVLGAGKGLTDSVDDIIPRFKYQQAVLPANIEVQGGPKLFQREIPLRAVGLDADGIVKPIDDLSYAPRGGWSRCWYTTFSDVPIGVRHLAFQSVWRWWEPVIDRIDLPIPLTELMQLKLHHALAEASTREDGVVRCAPPLVLGSFWPQTDHPYDTGPLTAYAGDFEIDAENVLVKFPYPVVSIGASGIGSPTLYLVTAFSVADGKGAVRDKARAAVGGAGPDRVIVRDDMRAIDNPAPVYFQPDNIDPGELQLLADAVAAGHQGQWASEVALEGLRQVDLTGRIAQIRWACGAHDSRPATTRVSENMEFDVFVPHYQERRRRERGDQVAGRVLR
jgi:hypothetical protein